MSEKTSSERLKESVKTVDSLIGGLKNAAEDIKDIATKSKVNIGLIGSKMLRFVPNPVQDLVIDLYVNVADLASENFCRGNHKALAAVYIAFVVAAVFVPALWPAVGVITAVYAGGYVQNKWFGGCVVEVTFSPLVLDLDNDGVETGGKAFIDHAGDGFAELTSWASEDDGVLVMDLDGDGVINRGAELFGDNTLLPSGGKAKDGFAALAALDSNGDGKVDANDAKWSDLRVLRWTDKNSNGIMDADEQRLETLEANSVKELKLGHAKSDKVDEAGNEHRLVGSYVDASGATQDMVDVWFQTEPSLRRYDKSAIPEHSESVKALQEAMGTGFVYDLRDAMALDDAGRLKAPIYKDKTRTETRKLAALVTAFNEADTKAERAELLDKIMHRWAGAEGVTHNDYGWNKGLDYTTAAKYAVVEAFQGGKITLGKNYRNPTYELAQYINRSYLALSERLRAELLLQKDYAAEFGMLQMKVGESVLSAVDDMTKLSEEQLSNVYLDFGLAQKALAQRGAVHEAEFVRSIASLFGQNSEAVTGLEKTAPSWKYRYDYQAAYLARSVSPGEVKRADDLHGDDGANVFRTTDDGADALRGGKGSDLYQLAVGTGHDRIYEAADAAGSSEVDVVMMGPDVAVADVRIRRDATSLWVEILGAAGTDGARPVTDSFKVEGHFKGKGIEQIMFADGTIWNKKKMASASYMGTAGNDVIAGDAGEADLFDSSAGGNDRLHGMGGDDTYMLQRGTGHDVIREGRDGGGNWRARGWAASGADRVLLGAGIGADDVRLRRDGAHLWVELLGTADASGARPVTDSLKVEDHYSMKRARIEAVEFADGTKWLASKLDAVAISGGAGDDVLEGLSATADVFDSAAGGNDRLYGKGGNDTYVLRRGTGHDVVNEGRDGNGTWRSREWTGSDADRVVVGAGIGTGDVRLRRDGGHLLVELLGAADEAGVRAVTDSLKIDSHYQSVRAQIERVEFADGTVWGAAQFNSSSLPGAKDDSVPKATEAIRGGTGNESLYGRRDMADIFDSDAGGNDTLYGKDGDDVYRLGAGTGHDTVNEHYSYVRSNQAGDDGDVVEVEKGYGTADVVLRRDEHHLWIELLGAADANGVRAVTDSLKIDKHYGSAAGSIEKVKFADGTTWMAAEFDVVAIRGSERNESLYGRRDMADIFDADAGGNDTLYGRDGDDVYRLGVGTGHDTVNEHYRYVRSNQAGDDGDVVEIEKGYGTADVVLQRDEHHLWIELLGKADSNGDRAVTDSLKIDNHYHGGAAPIEKVKFSDGVAWTATEFNAVAIRGGTGNESLYGRRDMADIFDADAGGNDTLYGRDGDDVYRLGAGTGHDTVNEHYRYVRSNQAGDDGDVVEIEKGYGTADVVLQRDEHHLWIELLGKADSNGDRAVTDSLKIDNHYHGGAAPIEKVKFSDGVAWTATEFNAVAIRGGTGNESLYGRRDMADIFDADAGGNDTLYGRDGDDVYRLGAGTGHDTVNEHYSYVRSNQAGDDGDVVEIEKGYGTADVVLRRDEHHLWIQLLGTADKDGARAVTDSLKIDNHYHGGAAPIEKVKFSDGTAWTATEFNAVAIRGGTGNESLYGRRDMADIFDADAGGNDTLYGRDGDDVYRLGAGTGHDTVNEHYSYVRTNQAGDDGDVVEIEKGYGTADVVLRRDEHHLWIQLLGTADKDGARAVTDSLKIDNHYHGGAAPIEKVKFSDGTAWTATEFNAVAIRGSERNESLYGRRDMADIFDADAGGDDTLYGKDGDDVYRLGAGTGHDTVNEHYSYVRSNQAGDDGDVVEIEKGYGTADVLLRRDEHHLWIQLLGPADKDGARAVTDSLKIDNHYHGGAAPIEKVKFTDGTAWTATEFDAVAIRGSERNESLYGRRDMADIFDADAGGNDTLYGRDGDDVYRLGAGTGHDTVNEHYSYVRSNQAGDDGDVVEIEKGYGTADVLLRRDEHHLWIQLLGPADKDGARTVTDSLKIDNHYHGGAAPIEKVKFTDGTAWTATEFDAVAIRGSERNESLYGRRDMADIFDADAGGNDTLYGRDGDDVYRLGAGTGHDTVNEHYSYVRTNQAGDDGDVVEIEKGYGTADVALRRDEHHLWIELLGKADANGVRAVTDSLQIDKHYSNASAKIEKIKFADGKVWAGPFAVGGSGADTLSSQGAGLLHGGRGDDVYQLAGSFGQDTVVDTGGTDKVQVSGHARTALAFERQGDDLLLKALATSNEALFEGWYETGAEERKIERFEAGGYALSAALAEKMASDMASFVEGGGTSASFLSKRVDDYWQAIAG